MSHSNSRVSGVHKIANLYQPLGFKEGVCVGEERGDMPISCHLEQNKIKTRHSIFLLSDQIINSLFVGRCGMLTTTALRTDPMYIFWRHVNFLGEGFSYQDIVVIAEIRCATALVHIKKVYLIPWQGFRSGIRAKQLKKNLWRIS